MPEAPLDSDNRLLPIISEAEAEEEPGPEKLQLPLNYFGRRDSMMESIMTLISAMTPSISKYKTPFDTCYDLFSGSASISVAAMEKQIAKNYVLNDACEPLQSFYQNVKDKPASVISEYNAWMKRFRESTNKKVFYNALKHTYQSQIPGPSRTTLFPILMNLSDGLPRLNRESRAISPFFSDTQMSISEEEFKTNVWYTNKLFLDDTTTITSTDFDAYELNMFSSNDLVILDAPYFDSFSRGLYHRPENTLSLHEKLLAYSIGLQKRNVPFLLFYGVDTKAENSMTGTASLVPSHLQFPHLTHCSVISPCGNYREHLYLPSNFPSEKLPKEIYLCPKKVYIKEADSKSLHEKIERSPNPARRRPHANTV